MKNFIIGLVATLLAITGFAQPTPVQVVEATTAQVAAGTVGAPYYVSPRRLAGGGGAGVFSSVTDTGLTAGRVVYAGTGGLLVDSSQLTFSGTALALGSAATSGIQLYNTVDQTTNYEKLSASWVSNSFELNVVFGGSGNASRILKLGVATSAGGTVGKYITIRNSTDVFEFVGGSSNTGSTRFINISGTNTATSGTNAGLSLLPIYNQASGAAANTDLLINRTETAVGSGAQNLVDLQVGSSSKFKVSNTGNVTSLGVNIVSTDTLSGAGAVSIIKDTTKLTSTGVAEALTLANGSDGQIKRVIHDVDGGSMVLTPTTKTGWSTATFTNAGDSLTLEYVTTRGWIVVGSYGTVVAP